MAAFLCLKSLFGSLHSKEKASATGWRLAIEADVPSDAPVWTEIDYLNRHGAEGHMAYATFRRRGLPLGSGAIESAIRRVINLRMKGNSIF